ncbi:KamA family radical SAM protein [Enterobacteriaceae endosymbiont of Donacia bicoloricornis]|uniref:KamA family radical SAM protein n=1 Tax=Enterobacteriaceae endosymbiont of Donacia bicoloricornis TaxID=2675772 RepID=UPI00144A0A8A|nr:KamA family radical SAM protein [Enterobacteriaceae endosymbiont of Donacia bicoloricornis]QJC37709.1 KamA family radical SAM protein [Enterobacteriaceae endosymbiont of Donacia bicoloricornis]
MKELWLKQLSNNINNNIDLIKITKIKQKDNPQFLYKKKNIFFNVKIPIIFLKKIEKKNPKDPILLQFIFNKKELIQYKKYNKNPLNEKFIIPGMIHKYKNRVLILLTGICAVHCRYCFRKNTKKINSITICNWKIIIKYIKKNFEINEIIFSGGDPLVLNDKKINFFINDINKIPHIKILRIHTRIICILPQRISKNLLKIFSKCKFHIVIVTHINHSNEISEELFEKINFLKKRRITILNQSVLLKNINDNYKILVNLSNNLFNIGILPYYLHLLDKIEGSKHFYVSENKAKKIMKKILLFLPGFLVPRLTKDIYGGKNKKFII